MSDDSVIITINETTTIIPENEEIVQIVTSEEIVHTIEQIIEEVPSEIITTDDVSIINAQPEEIVIIESIGVGPQGIKGDKGDAGESISTYSAQSDSNGIKGQPIHIKMNGHLELAQANVIGLSTVGGFLLDPVAVSFSGTYIKNGPLTLEDWTQIIGSINLIPGTNYFLSAEIAGMLTEIAPSAVGQFVCQIGQATSITTLAIEIHPKILL